MRQVGYLQGSYQDAGQQNMKFSSTFLGYLGDKADIKTSGWVLTETLRGHKVTRV